MNDKLVIVPETLTLMLADARTVQLRDQFEWLLRNEADLEHSIAMLRREINYLLSEYYEAFSKHYSSGLIRVMSSAHELTAANVLDKLIKEDALQALTLRSIKAGLNDLDEQYNRHKGHYYRNYRG